jgi:hypothetical protein
MLSHTLSIAAIAHPLSSHLSLMFSVATTASVATITHLSHVFSPPFSTSLMSFHYYCPSLASSWPLLPLTLLHRNILPSLLPLLLPIRMVHNCYIVFFFLTSHTNALVFSLFLSLLSLSPFSHILLATTTGPFVLQHPSLAATTIAAC